jgi:hypothetical protein
MRPGERCFGRGTEIVDGSEFMGLVLALLALMSGKPFVINP